MTPIATTPSGRTGQGTGGYQRAAHGHRQGVRRQPAPRIHRRVSGPAGGDPAARTPALPRPGTTPVRDAVSAPLLLARAGAFVAALPDHAVIDRLVRGRAWILALGVMLTGIVAMQVELLKLGANIGRSVQRASVLQVRNQQLQSGVASLADDQRIEKLAAGMGMAMAPPGSVGFLAARPDVGPPTAVTNLHSPSSATFLISSSSNGSVVTPTSIAAANAPTRSSATSTGTVTLGSTAQTPSTTGPGITAPSGG